MPTRTREFIIAVDDPTLSGLYESFDSRIDSPQFFLEDGEFIGWRFAKRAPIGSGQQLVQIDAPAVVRVNVGDPDTAPTGGASYFLFTNTTTTADEGLNISAGASAAAAQTAISASLTSVGLGPATVTKHGECDYLITFDNAGAVPLSITELENRLVPESEIVIKREQVGSSSQVEVWRLTVAQKGIAFATPTTAYDTQSNETASIDVAGSWLVYSVQTLALDIAPIGGFGTWSALQRQQTTITAIADSAGSLHNKSVCTLYDGSGLGVQIVLSNGSGGSAPTAPVGGRNVSVTFVNNDTAATIARKIYVAIASDSALDSVSNSESVVVISSPTSGEITGNAGFTVSRTRDARQIYSVLPYNASADDIATALGDIFSVSVIDEKTWTLTATEFGEQNAVGLDVGNMTFPIGVQSELAFTTIAAAQARGNASENTITTTLQVRTEPTGESPRVVLSVPCTLGINTNRTT